MSCDRTEYRLLLHAHDALGWWEKWLLKHHLAGCPGCCHHWEQFREERRVLSRCLMAPQIPRVADRVALELGVPRPSSGPRMVVSRRVPILFLLLAGLLAASAAVAYVQWRAPDSSISDAAILRQMKADCLDGDIPGDAGPAKSPAATVIKPQEKVVEPPIRPQDLPVCEPSATLQPVK